jgi:CheY-like chemotaxis protein
MLDIDTPLFVVGEKKEINVVREVIPESAISGIFYRPINTLEMVEFFDDFIKNYRPREKKRILAVDDNGSMLRNLKSWLSERYTVDVATSGSMAIRSMVMRKPDLVLLDYEMPVADGPTVLEMIKADPEFRDIPTMFLTAKGDKDSVIRGLALKPEGYLLKSLTPQKIVESIDDFFHEQRINEKRRQLEASSMK